MWGADKSAWAMSEMALRAFKDDPRRWGALAACCLVAAAQLVEPRLNHIWVSIPFEAFGASMQRYQFVASISRLLFMASMLLGGLLGDLIGRRKIFVATAMGYTGFTILSAFAINFESYLVFRFFTAILGGMVLPLTLATIRSIFHERERIYGILIYTVVTSVASLLSLLAMIIEPRFGWQATLIPPIVFGTLGSALAWNYLPITRALGGWRRADGIAAAVWSLLFVGLMYGLLLVQFVVSGWVRLLMIVAISGGLVLVAIGVARWQHISAERTPGLKTVPVWAVALLLFISAALSFALINYPMRLYSYFNVVRNFNVVVAGIALVPMLLTMLSAFQFAVTITKRYTMPQLIAGGMGLMAFGILLTAGAGTTTPYILLVPPMILFTFGYLIASVAWSEAFLRVIPEDLIGVNVGMGRAAGTAGSAIGGLFLASILIYSGQLAFERRALAAGVPPEQLEGATAALNAVLRREQPMLPEDVPPELATAVLLGAYHEAYAVGTATGLLVMGGVYSAIIAVIWYGLRWVSLHEKGAVEIFFQQAELEANEARGTA